MKLLLTSGGLTNESISKALFDLVGKKPEDTNLVFIPTAANVEVGDKGWIIDDLVNFKKQNFKSIDIVDISAIEQKLWQPRLEAADIIFFGGGNVFHLMEWINKSGLVSILSELLKTRVYAGLSAGSMVTSKDLALNLSKIIYGEDLDKTENMKALGFVDFYFFPHLNSPWFKKVRKKNIIKEAYGKMTEKIYALDDKSALKVVDGKIEVISEGEWFEIN